MATRKRIRWSRAKGKQPRAKVGRCELVVGKAPGEPAWFRISEIDRGSIEYRGVMLAHRTYVRGQERTIKLAKAKAVRVVRKLAACSTPKYRVPRRRRR